MKQNFPTGIRHKVIKLLKSFKTTTTALEAIIIQPGIILPADNWLLSKGRDSDWGQLLHKIKEKLDEKSVRVGPRLPGHHVRVTADLMRLTCSSTG